MHSPPRSRAARRLAALALLAPLAAPAGALAPAQEALPRLQARRQIEASTSELATWLPGVVPGQALGAKRREWLEGHVRDLVVALDWVPDELVPVASALLDLASYRMDQLPTSSSFLGGDTTYVLRRLGHDALTLVEEDGHREAVVDWLARGVLADRERNSDARRWFALWRLREEPSPLVSTILLRIAKDEGDPLRLRALSELPNRPHPDVDAYLVQQLESERILGLPHPFNLLRQRLQKGPLDAEAAGLLVRHVKTLLFSEDWRTSSRGIELCEDLSPRRSAAMLVEALYTWKNREERGFDNSRRIVWDIVRVLRRLSGRTIGDNPRGWMTWWTAVREGRVDLDAIEADEAGAESTAEFLGLRPVSDRVTFVMDHSASMDWEWRRSGNTRYEWAIEKLMEYLQAAGEQTKFNIVLFNSQPIVSSPLLVEATPRNLERAQQSLASRTPFGATNLRSAIERALKYVPGDPADPDSLEIDTIVVLCDGETQSGPGWVDPFLDEVHEDLRVVFYCVQIGDDGDGTLERLAARTGGEFVRIGE